MSGIFLSFSIFLFSILLTLVIISLWRQRDEDLTIKIIEKGWMSFILYGIAGFFIFFAFNYLRYDNSLFDNTSDIVGIYWIKGWNLGIFTYYLKVKFFD